LGEQYKSFRSSVCSLLHSPVNPSNSTAIKTFNILLSHTITRRRKLRCKRRKFADCYNGIFIFKTITKLYTIAHKRIYSSS
jgi:hypothetical protein